MGIQEPVGEKSLKASFLGLLALFALTGAVVAAGAYGSYRFFADRMVAGVHDELLGISRMKAERIGEQVADRRGSAFIFATRPAVWRLLSGADAEREMPRVRMAIDKTVTGQGYLRIVVVDAALRIVVSSSSEPLGPEELSAVRQAIATREPVRLELHRNAEGEVEHGFIHPVFANGDEHDVVVGAAYLERNAEARLLPLLEGLPRPSPSMETIMARRDGDEVLFLSHLRFRPEAPPLTFRQPVGTGTLAENALVRNEFGLIEGRDYRGEEVIGAAEPVPGTPWVIVTKVDRAEVERPARVLALIVLALAAVLILLLAVIFQLSWRRRNLELRAERAAEAERFALALRTSIDGYMMVDRTGRLVAGNAALSRMTGYAEEELIHLHVSDLDANETPAEAEAHMVRILAQGSDRFETRFRRKDGMRIDVEISVSITGDYFHAFIHDVSERRAAEKALRESEARFRQMFERNTAVLLLIEPTSGAIVDANAAASLFYGYGVDRLRTMTIDRINTLPPEEIAAERANAVRHERNFFTFPHRLADGETRTVEVRSSPVNVGGRILLFSIVQDVTERKQAEEELARSNAELEQFAYAASHDLRQPLRMISSYLGLLQRKLGDSLDEDGRTYMAFAIDGAKRMDALILGLLDYSRVGRVETVTEIVDLGLAVDEAIKDLELMIEETGTDLPVADDLPSVAGHPLELTRLFLNLIGNAIKYRAKGRPPRVDVGWRDGGAEWVVWVRDNGIGIAPRDHDRAFGIFQRLVGRKEVEGNGIGLAICRKIVEHHGGRIWIESTPGEGSTFLVALPKPKESGT
ncbi:MAG: PAS domain S-box protein [Alphaproteobacteria bacterium]|nr:PAS domain S-box protein [Alphaproteobacteria bacterium]